MLIIRNSSEEDLEDILAINRAAFGTDEEANLVSELLKDSTAEPLLSLLAVEGNQAVGHILFTRAHLEGNPSPLLHILAPMAVRPEAQRSGIGMTLIHRGLGQLREAGSELVFVLGHPDYYPRAGFLKDAGQLGLKPTFPIDDAQREAWMVIQLRPGAIKTYSGRIICCEKLSKPEYWVE